MRPFRVEAPTAPLVSFEGPDGLQAHCRVDTADEQGLIVAYEQAAVDYLDGYTGRLGRCILRQKWALPLAEGQDVIDLPFPDCRDFAVEQLDAEGSWTTIEGVGFQTGQDCVALVDLPADLDGLHLTFVAGWNSAEEVPANIKQAVRLLVAHWFDNRADMSAQQTPHQLPMAVEAMIAPLSRVFA